jgi:colanic acid/amylovoran biosynthesis glycosyltransferase
MGNNKPSVLIILSRLPDDISFLTAKFIGVNKELDIDILSWDTSTNRRKYYKILKAQGFRGKIYLAPINFSLATALKFTLANVPFFLLRLPAVLRFIRVGSKVYGKDIFKRLFFNSYFLRSRHDLWHFEFGATSSWYSYLKKIFPEKRMTVSFRGYDLNYIGLADSNYYLPTWEAFDGFHFLGHDLKHRAIRRGYVMKGVEAIIPPAIDIGFFKQDTRNQTNSKKLIIVSTGRLVWKKGFENGIKAAALLREKNVPFEYRIIGEGNHLQALQFIISELGLQHEVKLLGRMDRNQVKDQLSEADVFLHPAISEGFCNAVLEAQAMGVPVVCTDADGLQENIVNNETGFAVPKWDITAMADKLEWIFNNRTEAKAMGLKGVQRVHTNFTLNDQIASFVEFYRKVYAS